MNLPILSRQIDILYLRIQDWNRSVPNQVHVERTGIVAREVKVGIENEETKTMTLGTECAE